jgi:hypothetical protein
LAVKIYLRTILRKSEHLKLLDNTVIQGGEAIFSPGLKLISGIIAKDGRKVR